MILSWKNWDGIFRCSNNSYEIFIKMKWRVIKTSWLTNYIFKMRRSRITSIVLWLQSMKTGLILVYKQIIHCQNLKIALAKWKNRVNFLIRRDLIWKSTLGSSRIKDHQMRHPNQTNLDLMKRRIKFWRDICQLIIRNCLKYSKRNMTWYVKRVKNWHRNITSL